MGRVNEGLMKIYFESRPVYGNDDKYIKRKITCRQHNHKFSQ